MSLVITTKMAEIDCDTSYSGFLTRKAASDLSLSIKVDCIHESGQMLGYKQGHVRGYGELPSQCLQWNCIRDIANQSQPIKEIDLTSVN